MKFLNSKFTWHDKKIKYKSVLIRKFVQIRKLRIKIVQIRKLRIKIAQIRKLRIKNGMIRDLKIKICRDEAY